MPYNNDAIIPLVADFQYITTFLCVPNTAHTGVGTLGTWSTDTIFPIFSSGPSGSFVKKIVFRPLGLNTIPSVIRLFINNGSDNTVLGNNALIREIPTPPTIANTSASNFPVVVPLNLSIPPNYRLLATYGTTGSLSLTGFSINVFNMDY